MMKARRWLIVIAALLFFWPRFVDLDDMPDTPVAARYRDEAEDFWWLMHNRPIQQVFHRAITQNLRFSDWRHVPGSCDGGSPAVREATDVLVTVTGIGPWGIPLFRDTMSCGGSAWSSRP